MPEQNSNELEALIAKMKKLVGDGIFEEALKVADELSDKDYGREFICRDCYGY